MTANATSIAPFTVLVSPGATSTRSVHDRFVDDCAHVTVCAPGVTSYGVRPSWPRLLPSIDTTHQVSLMTTIADGRDGASIGGDTVAASSGAATAGSAASTGSATTAASTARRMRASAAATCGAASTGATGATGAPASIGAGTTATTPASIRERARRRGIGRDHRHGVRAVPDHRVPRDRRGRRRDRDAAADQQRAPPPRPAIAGGDGGDQLDHRGVVAGERAGAVGERHRARQPALGDRPARRADQRRHDRGRLRADVAAGVGEVGGDLVAGLAEPARPRERAQLAGRIGGAVRPVVGVARHQPLEHARQLGADRWPPPHRRRHLPGRQLREHARRTARVGQRAGGELVERDPERVDVAARGRGVAGRLLRRHVRRGAEHRAGAGDQRVLGLEPGDPEVGEQYPAALRDQHVRRLDVAVDDAGGVGRGERVGEQRADRRRDLGEHRAALLDLREQRAAADDSMTMNGGVRAALSSSPPAPPTSKILRMFGWSRPAAARASR